LSPGAHAIFFVVPFVATVGALAVLYVWALATFPALEHHRRQLLAVLALLVVADRGADTIVVRWHDSTAGVVHAVLVLVLTAIVLAGPPVAAIHFVGRAIRKRACRGEQRPAALSASLPRRQLVEGVCGAAAFAATGSMLGWGAVRGRHAFTLEEVPLRIPGLPRALDGYVIVQVSDVHAGVFVGARELDEGIAVVRRARPDLVVVTGDLVDYDPAYAPAAARKLADVPARDGVVAILGNHDYYAGADEVAAALHLAGVSVLRNAGKIVRPGDGGFALLGVNDLAALRRGGAGPLLDQALANVPTDAPRILLSHQPITVDLWPGRVAAQLSGHTHGGQINPGLSPLGLMMKYLAGPYDVSGTMLYVNRGFGTVGAPSRIGAPPEVTRFVLVSA
jgi:predicted MPP superfamily phosphohydrolase